MTQLQTYHYTEWDTTYHLRQLGEVEVLAIQDVCTLLNSWSASQTGYTPQSIMEHVISKFDEYEGATYLWYKEMGVIKLRREHYEPLQKLGNTFSGIFFNNIATMQLMEDLCEMNDEEAEEQIDQIFKNSLSLF